MITAHHIPDAIFRTDNPLGIPVLDLSLQAEWVVAPVMPWGSVKRNQKMPGIWHFYTQDYRFTALEANPGLVLNTDCASAVEPNFTTSEQMPNTPGWMQIYRKRWIARFWQEMGLPVWVDMNVAPDFYYANLLGVPDGWNAYFTRGYSERLEWTGVEYQLAQEKSGRDAPLFIVYGGGAAVEAYCMDNGIQWLPEAMDCRKGKLTHG